MDALCVVVNMTGGRAYIPSHMLLAAKAGSGTSREPMCVRRTTGDFHRYEPSSRTKSYLSSQPSVDKKLTDLRRRLIPLTISRRWVSSG